MVEYVFSLPSSYKIDQKNRKKILKETFYNELPKEVFSRKKHGFEIPLNKWFKNELQSFIENDIFRNNKALKMGLINEVGLKLIEKKWRDRSEGNTVYHIWSLIILDNFLKNISFNEIKKRILRIINRFNLGGPTYNAAYLTKYLPDDYETLLVGGNHEESEGSSMHIIDELGLDPIIIPEMQRAINPKKDRIALKKIQQLIADFKPDIVHTHASKAGALGRKAAHKAGVAQIYHTFHGHVFHSYFGTLKTNLYKKIERNLAKKSTKIIAISEIQKKELSEVHQICPANKIVVIPLGFDLARFYTNKEEKRINFRKEWNIDDDEIAIGIIGRIVPIKDHAFFVNVIEKVLQKNFSKNKGIYCRRW